MNSKRPIKFLGLSVFVSLSSLLLLFMLSTIVLLLPIRSAFADSYDDGSDEGCFDARRDLQGLNGHGYDESVNHGDSEFRSGYVDGYRDCWNGGDDQSRPQDTDREQTGNNPSFDRSQTDGYDWTGVCNTLQPALHSSCNSLVNDDGSLTSDGIHAMHCIRNGALLDLGAGGFSS